MYGRTRRQPMLYPATLRQDRGRATQEIGRILMSGPKRSQAVDAEIQKATGGNSALAQALMAKDPNMKRADRMAIMASDTSPVQHPLQGMARLLQGYGARTLRNEAETQATETADRQNAAMAQVFGDQLPAGFTDLPASAQEAVLTNAMKDQEPEKPIIETLYDDQGREYKAQWTGTGWQQIGGAKMNADAPTVQTFYDRNGREYKAQWDGQEWQQIGGSKALAASGDAPGTGFAGTGMTAQQANALEAYTRAVQAGQTPDPTTTRMASFAWGALTQPETITLPDGRVMERPGMDLTSMGYANPMGGGGPVFVEGEGPQQSVPGQAVQLSGPASPPTASGTEIAPPTAVVEAREGLPQARDNATYVAGLVRGLVEHPGFASVVGMPEPSLGSVAGRIFTRTEGQGDARTTERAYAPGSDEANFQARLNQLRGQNFLQAFESLRGGGVISDNEGRKAEAAISRLAEIGQSETAYREAAQEFLDVMRMGLERQYRQAGEQMPADVRAGLTLPPIGQGNGAQGGGRQGTGGNPGSPTRMRYNPTTGKMEPVK